MMWFYLIALLVSLGCLTLVDWKYKLAFFHDARRSAMTIAVVVGMFIIWDVLGIQLGIFFHGGSPYTLPLRIIPEFPLEELFFLILLCYSTLLVFRFFSKGKK
jgi:lycopene cyclase domain-containing protein